MTEASARAGFRRRRRPYSEYRVSGEPWLGEIPSHWEVVRSKALFRLRRDKARGGQQQLTASQRYGVIPQDEFMAREGRRVVQVVHRPEILKHVEPGDFVISMRSFQGGLELSHYRGNISSAYVMLEPRGPVHAPLFAHLFKSSAYVQALQSTSNYVRDGQELRYENFAQVPLPVLDLSEQRAIAAFLDRETAKIDGLVADKERLVELLQEKRTALITRAVTRGLDPNVPMKDSGVEWLGEIPAHWEVVPFKRAIDYLEGPGIMAADFLAEGVPLLRISGIRGRWATLDGSNYLSPETVWKRWSHFQVRSGDLLISGSASTGFCAEVDEETAGAIPYTGIIIIRPRAERVLKNFARWMLLSDVLATQVDLARSGSTIQHFGPSHLAGMLVVAPPRQEQHAIADFLDRETTSIDALIAKILQAIGHLREFRTALISAAVTGKIDVREQAA